LKIQQLNSKVQSSKEKIEYLIHQVPIYYKKVKNAFQDELLSIEYELKHEHQQNEILILENSLFNLENQKNRLNLMKKTLNIEHNRTLDSLNLIENIYSHLDHWITGYQNRMVFDSLLRNLKDEYERISKEKIQRNEEYLMECMGVDPIHEKSNLKQLIVKLEESRKEHVSYLNEL
jgi:hypothetical protein